MRLPADQQKAAVGAALEAFPWLAERSAQRAGTLSGGEQQMLAVAQAFVDPAARSCMIDEFSLGLAPKIVEQLAEAVRRIADAGSAVLVVEQSAPIAARARRPRAGHGTRTHHALRAHRHPRRRPVAADRAPTSRARRRRPTTTGATSAVTA